MKSKYLLALTVIAVFLALSVVPALAYTPTYRVTVIVWNRDTHKALAGVPVYLTQGLLSNCEGKPPLLVCDETAQSYNEPFTNTWGKTARYLPAMTVNGVWSPKLPLTVWVYDFQNEHYNTYGPYALLPYDIIFIPFSTSD